MVRDLILLTQVVGYFLPLPRNFSLQNILHAPQLITNLLSVQQFTKDNEVFFEFHPSCFFVKDRATQTTLLQGPSNDGLYCLSVMPSTSPQALLSEKTTIDGWHRRLGHPHSSILHQIIKHNNLACKSFSSTASLCTSCQLGKASRLLLSPSPH